MLGNLVYNPSILYSPMCKLGNVEASGYTPRGCRPINAVPLSTQIFTCDKVSHSQQARGMDWENAHAGKRNMNEGNPLKIPQKSKWLHYPPDPRDLY
jgi:hypothetical protein